MDSDSGICKIMLILDLYARVFILVFARLIGLFLTAPFFSSKMISRRFKVAIMFWMGISVMFVVPIPNEVPEVSIYYFFLIAHDLLIGAAIGFVGKIIFTGIQFAGSLMDQQMGLSVASSFDPLSGAQTTIMARLIQLWALIIFLTLNGHHILLSGVYSSFRMFPVTETFSLGNAVYPLIEITSLMFYIGVQIASPIILVIFLLDFSFGLISRVAPQVNVFMLGFQMKPTLGLTIFFLLLPMTMSRIIFYLQMFAEKFTVLFVAIQGGA